MSERVAAVVSTPQAPPHAYVVSTGAINAQAQQAQASDSGSSLVLPVTAGAIAIGAAAVGIYAADKIIKQRKSKATNELCYMHAANAITDGQVALDRNSLHASLREIYIRKYRAMQQEPKATRKRSFANHAELVEAADRSAEKSLRNGLSAARMMDLLNLQVEKLARLNPQATPAYRQTYLRNYGMLITGTVDVAAHSPEAIFPCEDVQRFVLLHFLNLSGARSLGGSKAAHYITIKHMHDAWFAIDGHPEKQRNTHILSGSATRTDASRALNAWLQKKYGTTHNVNATVIHQLPRV